VIVIVAVLLTCFMASGALAIDLGSARQSQTQAQSAADAAALAVSDSYSSGTTSIAALQLVANQMVATNDPGAIAGVPVLAAGVWSVGVTGSSAGTLGGKFGHASIPVSAAAGAAVSTSITTSTGTSTSTLTSTITSTKTSTVTNTSTGTVTSLSCPAVGNGCLAIFASGTSCGGDSNASNDPVVFGGGVHITGGTWSDGSIDLGGGGSSWGPLTYKSGCSISPTGTSTPPTYQENSSTFNGGFPVAAAALAPWPLDYSTDFPACSGSACSGPLGTPSFCTQASTANPWSLHSYTPATMSTGQVYCAVGSGTAKTPSTWNGAIAIGGGGVSSSFIGGSISTDGGNQLAACGYSSGGFAASTCGAPAPAATANYPLFYATTGSISEPGGTALTGDWFAPKGTITVGGGTDFVGFLQAITVDMPGGGLSGDGPPSSGGTIGSTSTTFSTSTSLSTSLSSTTSTSTSTSLTSTTSAVNVGSRLTG
jgi:trimeric autotransporter adhesin